jgi:hypothetical protein
MPDKFKTQLTVNDMPVELNEFAHQFITNIVICAVSILKGGEDVKTLNYSIVGSKIDLVINDKRIPLTPFPKAAVTGTITGMVSSLRGVNKIDNLILEIKAA